MTDKQKRLSVSLLDELHTPGAGYDVLRYISLPELLGRESDSLLYFMGRKLARKFDLQEFEAIYSFFKKVGWGYLELAKERQNEFAFHLMADAVAARLRAPFETEFRLEAGFLAEAVQMIRGYECECVEEINPKIGLVSFRVVYTK